MLDRSDRALSALARRVARRLGRGGSHPLVLDSRIENPSTVDSSARVFRSTLAGDVLVGRAAILDDCNIRGNAPVEIGDYSSLSGPIRIVADLNPVSIGKFCAIAPDVAIWESNHRADRASSYFMMLEVFKEGGLRDLTSNGPVQVGHDVWIGTRSLVLSGAAIGDGAVIAAGSVVTGHVPPYAIAAGAPAKVLRYRFPEPLRRQLAELCWWDWTEDRIKRNRALFEGELTQDLIENIE